MPASEYDTVEYQRGRMYNALGLAVVCFIGLCIVSYLEIVDVVGYILAFGVIIGVYGFFDHRKYMRKLKEPIRTKSSTSW
jgi:Kef-type K+ transport system membrane component KefB